MLLSLLKSLRRRAEDATQSPASHARVRLLKSELDEFTSELTQLVGAKIISEEQENFDGERWPMKGGQQVALDRESRYCADTLRDLLNNQASYAAARRLLQDDESRNLFLMLMAYRLLGHRHVRLPANNAEHWRLRAAAKEMPSHESEFSGLFGKLRRYDLEFEHERITVNCWWMNVAWTFLIRQYYFSRGGASVAPRPGDRVLDCGACFGETALAFAASAGNEGRVFSFEIDPANVAVARRNMEQNSQLARRISLSERALAHRADLPLFRHGSGPGAAVGSDPSEYPVSVTTVDSMLDSGEIDRVDFIKMDIEGTELFALTGARKTLERFRPRLAISLYHRIEDLWEIPIWLDALGLGYRFYLDHYTIHHEETVLYAIAEDE